MIYLFCNQQYGLQLMQTATAYSKNNKVALSIVFSYRRPLIKNKVKKMIFHYRYVLRKFIQEKHLSLCYGVPFVLTENVNSESFLKRITPRSHGVIAGFNQIFRKETIARFETIVNFHPSILPLYRGPVPSYWCIFNGERATGYTLHEITEKIDEGRTLFQEVVEIDEEIEESALDEKIASAACPTLVMYLNYIHEKTSWKTKTVNAYKIYDKHVSYTSFPKR
jgi:methionyl-tRNA formyltransferase